MVKRYRALVGMNYPPNNRRVEAGEIADGLPARSIPWLLEQGHIELVSDEPEPAASPPAGGGD